MATFEYYADGKLQSMAVQTPDALEAAAPKPGVRGSLTGSAPVVREPRRALQSQPARFAALFRAGVGSPGIAIPEQGGPVLIPTETIVIDGARQTELKWLHNKFGLSVVREGRQGKVLLSTPEGGAEGVKTAFEAAKVCYERKHVGAAHPNFLRIFQRVAPSSPAPTPLWNHHNNGSPGRAGADVATLAAWTITRGVPEIRIAVLDEGIDTQHPALQPAVVAETDFVNGNPHARPDGNDAHGTACAGIIVSRDPSRPGLAPNCSLVAVRIAKGDGDKGWIFDDFETADAIDWAWEAGEADVLSNSWGGGPPVDVISRAFKRARTRGRKGKGAVIVCAAGNSNTGVEYPATLPGVLTVGASNQWDERKTLTSKDGEDWWASCFGPELDLLAPGVQIATCDIQGAAGYSSDNFVTNFNGTSSATPHVAAAAALILSVVPDTNEQRVREVITEGADRLVHRHRRTDEVGRGRLNLFAALRLARR